jgi:hypothetical protein
MIRSSTGSVENNELKGEEAITLLPYPLPHLKKWEKWGRA